MDVDHLIARTKLREDILSCTNCNLHDVAKAPVPFDGPSPNNVMVVGEAPGEMEDITNVPFVGPSGRLLKEMMMVAGFNLLNITFVNSVCCYPKRTPTTNEIVACSSNLKRQVELVNPTYIIAVGGIALSALCTTPVRMGEARGIWWHPSRFKSDAWVISTFHPAAVLRNISLKEKVEEDLLYARLVVDQTMVPDRGYFCLRCKDLATLWVNDLPWCEKHKPKGK